MSKLNIKVLGRGCPRCNTLLDSVQTSVKSLGLVSEIEHVTDLKKIMEYGTMSMPALVINDQVVSRGAVLKPAKVEKLLNKYAG